MEVIEIPRIRSKVGSDWSRGRRSEWQGCQIFVLTYQNGKYIPNYHKLYQTALNYEHQNIPNGHINSNFFHFKTLQIIHKLVFLVLK
jgi:hypothetical protein